MVEPSSVRILLQVSRSVRFRIQADRPSVLDHGKGFFSGGMPLRQRARSCETPSSNRFARIVQRRAAIQNCCLCPVQQNLCVDPPVARGVKVRSHHRQRAFEAEFWAGWSAGLTDPMHADAP